MTPEAMRSLFRVVGEDRLIAGSTILRRVTDKPLLDNVRDYLLDRMWGLEIIEPASLPKPPRNIPIGYDRDQIDEYRLMLGQGRPLEPVVITEDGLILVGWHRAVAAKETGKRLAAYVPQRMRRKRK